MTTKKSKFSSFINSLLIIVGLLLLVIVLGLVSVMQASTKSAKDAAAAVESAKSVSPAPALYTTIDGCDVYRFNDEGGHNYVARCPNGKVSTTDAKGRHIITETK